MKSCHKLILRIVIYTILLLFLFIYIILCKMGLGLPCLFNTLFGVQCPSCGASRSFLALLNGDFISALKFNPIFTLAFYPIGFILAFQDLFIAVYRVIAKADTPSIIEFLFGCENRFYGKD